MFGVGLPIGNLKRIEIYLFIGGAFVAMSWTLNYLCPIEGKNISMSSFIPIGALLITWLASSVLLYVSLLVWSYSFNALAGHIYKKYPLGKHAEIVGIDVPERTFVTVEHIEELNSSYIINGIIITSCALSSIPFNCLLTSVFVVKWYAYWGGVVVFIGIIFYELAKTHRLQYSYGELVKNNVVDYLDLKKYAEEIAVDLAKIRNDNFRALNNVNP
jgi:hypothetical protein